MRVVSADLPTDNLKDVNGQQNDGVVPLPAKEMSDTHAVTGQTGSPAECEGNGKARDPEAERLVLLRGDKLRELEWANSAVSFDSAVTDVNREKLRHLCLSSM